ncbi:MAG: hypothetical protein LUE64_05530, partial [Candidatus Gastranaerophilales bacterium]|nr:hypothetical protein [Candidatus Gastranaerophilales bacterium]
ILVMFNGLNSQKKVVPCVILYDIKMNRYKNISFSKLKNEVKAANGANIVVSGLNGKNFVIETFDDAKEKFLTSLDIIEKNYSSVEVLANGRYLILDVWQKPLMIFDPKNHKTLKFENPPVYFTEVKGGNLVFVEEKNSAMFLSYFDTEKYNKKNLLSAKKIDIRPVIGYLKNSNYIVARINGEDFSVNALNGEKYKIENSEDNNFMIDIGNNKYVINKTNAAYILDLTTGKIIPTGKLTGWPSNFSYPLDEDNTIIINDMTDKTFIANNKTDEIKKFAALSGKYYHTYPHKVMTLNDGTIIARYVENCSETEKNLKELGKILDIFSISLCSGKNYAFCSEFNSIPYYSYTVTDIRKKKAK